MHFRFLFRSIVDALPPAAAVVEPINRVTAISSITVSTKKTVSISGRRDTACADKCISTVKTIALLIALLLTLPSCDLGPSNTETGLQKQILHIGNGNGSVESA